MTLALLFLATCFLAYSNGANDNFKGVASLFGSQTCNYRTAISWATVTTFAGSIMSIFLAHGLLKKFSGKGIVPDHFVGSEYFLLAVAIGAGLTVIIATLTGFPISTTHALTGAIMGCGFVAVGLQVNLSALGKGFFLPLLLSPVLAIAVAGVLYILFHALRVATGTTKDWCVCVGAEERIVAMLLLWKALDIRWGFAAVAIAMAIGGLLNARRVAGTMSRKITAMNHGQGFSANLTTAILVVSASLFGLPVSTTHVSVGSLFGIGLTTGKANLRMMSAIVLSWLVTLPCAAILAGYAYWLTNSLFP